MTANSTYWEADLRLGGLEDVGKKKKGKISLSLPAPELLSTDKLVIKWRAIMAKIHVLDNEISIYTLNDEDYICITDIARYKDPDRTKLYYSELVTEQEYHRIPGNMGAAQ